MISMRIRGVPATEQTLRGLPQHLKTTVIFGLSQVAYDEAQRGALRHHKTGALFQSLYNRATPNGRAVGHDPNRAPHAILVNTGSRPHIIVPKRRSALRFSVGGRFAFAKRVRHPGYRGDGYIMLAADAAIRRFASIVDNAMKGVP